MNGSRFSAFACSGLCAAALLGPAGDTLALDNLVHAVEIEVGVGYDSNPLLAPGAPYFDQNRERVITAFREPGFRLPARLDGSLELPLDDEGPRFVLDYRAKGDTYPESEVSGANEAFAKVEPGLIFDLGGASRWDRLLDLRVFTSYDKEVYYDRETGSNLVTSDEIDVSNRYDYFAFGSEVVLDFELNRTFAFVLEAEVEKRDYSDPDDPDVEAFDHNRRSGSAGIRVRLARSVRLELNFDREARDYWKRRARSLDGQDPLTNPLLEYETDRLTANLRLRPRRSWTLELRWNEVDRTDEYVGYNDYLQIGYRVRSTIKTDRLRWRVSAEYWDRDFDRAFIFDEQFVPDVVQLNPTKRVEAIEFSLDGHVAWKAHMRPMAEITYTDRESADPRLAYRRTRTMVGFEFMF